RRIWGTYSPMALRRRGFAIALIRHQSNLFQNPTKKNNQVDRKGQDKKMKKLLWLPKVVAGVVLDTSVFCSSLAAQTVPVTVQRADEITLSTQLEAVGDLLAFESIAITPVVSKTIVELHFNDGDRVKKGQV